MKSGQNVMPLCQEVWPPEVAEGEENVQSFYEWPLRVSGGVNM